jgi:hypothetical protein
MWTELNDESEKWDLWFGWRIVFHCSSRLSASMLLNFVCLSSRLNYNLLCRVVVVSISFRRIRKDSALIWIYRLKYVCRVGIHGFVEMLHMSHVYCFERQNVDFGNRKHHVPHMV